MPRPVARVGGRSAGAVANLAPHSCSAMVSTEPPILGVSSTGRKDTPAHLEATGQSTVSIVDRALAEAASPAGGAWTR